MPQAVDVEAVGDANSEIQKQVQERFLELLRTEFTTMCVASLAFVTLGIVFDRMPVVWVCVFGVACGFFRQYGRRFVRRGDIRTAVIIFTAGQWASTLAIVWVLPITLPVILFNLIVPVLLGSTYLDDRDHAPLAYAAMVVAGLIGVLGLTQDRFELTEGVSPTFVSWATIVFMVGYTWMFTATVRDANRTRVEILDRALQSNAELVETRDELLASRRRLVEVADQERGRIERNIHDGAQQRLVSLAVQLRLAQTLADAGQPPTGESLVALHEEATSALAELRELAAGIYPSLLAERGVVDALAAAGRRGSQQVTVASDGPLDLTEDIEAAVYFFCLEAIQNAAKHAGPDAAIDVSFGQAERDLTIRIADDGLGFDPDSVGASRGLLNMADRVKALGGSFELQSAPGGGTAIDAVIPTVSSTAVVRNDR